MAPPPDMPIPAPATGWDQAAFRCGQCGAVCTAATEADYLKVVDAHREAHGLLERLHPVERDGLASILRTVLPAADLCTEILALVDQAGGRG